MGWLNLIESISVIAASCFAIYGIFTWKNETRWKRKYDLAEEMLANCYEAKEAIKAIRSSFGHSNEGKSLIKEMDPEKVISTDEMRIYALQERYQNNQNSFNNINKLKFRFMVNFGKEHKELFDKFNQIVNKIMYAANDLKFLNESNEVENKKEKRLELLKIIYNSWGNESDDPILKFVNEVIADIEDICRNIINSNFKTSFNN